MKLPNTNSPSRIIFDEIYIPCMKRQHPFYVLHVHGIPTPSSFLNGQPISAKLNVDEPIVLDNGRTYLKFGCEVQLMGAALASSIGIKVFTPMMKPVTMYAEPIEITSIEAKGDVIIVHHDGGDFVKGDVVVLSLCSPEEMLASTIDMLNNPLGFDVIKSKKKCFEIQMSCQEDLSGVTGYVLNSTLQASCVLRVV